MAKIVFPKAGEKLVCRKCGADVPVIAEGSEDGMLDDYWCDDCVAFTRVKAVRRS